MRLIVTGGGTGGHVYPALEIARAAMALGHDVMYFGSLRGQEKAACEQEGVVFRGFSSGPFLGYRSLKGLRSGFRLYMAGRKARGVVAHADPDVIFSTGGYSSQPIVSAARSLEIPFLILEQNSVPGRVNKGAGPDAHAVCTVFKETERHLSNSRVIRTGMPVRSALREAASRKARYGRPLVLVMGGSQGAAALNRAALDTAPVLGGNVRWLHIAGRDHFEEVAARAATELSGIEYEVKPFLDSAEMAEALASASVAVCRSGAGTLSELAAFGLPSVLVPYPSAHGGHQLKNAMEFSQMGAAALIEQEDLSVGALRGAIKLWLEQPEASARAAAALSAWYLPDATETILELLATASGSHT